MQPLEPTPLGGTETLRALFDLNGAALTFGGFVALVMELRRRNAAETHSAVCHSHDFCDANLVMDAAFKAVTGASIGEREEAGNGGMTDAEIELWSDAWHIAKRDSLTAPKGGGFIGRDATESAEGRATLWL